MWHQGAYDEATELLEQALVIFQQLGDQYGIANTLNGMAIIETYRLAYDHATELFQQCIHIHQQLNNQRGIARIVFVVIHILMTAGRRCIKVIAHGRYAVVLFIKRVTDSNHKFCTFL